MVSEPSSLFYLLLIGTFIPLETQSQAVTRDDINYLQGLIGQQQAEIDALLEKVTLLVNLEAVVGELDQIVVALANDLAAANAKIAGLEQDVLYLSQQLTGLNSKIDGVASNLNGVALVVEELSVFTVCLNSSVAKLNATTKHHHKVNQLWKHNFRAINNTFRSIRKKVSFKLPVMRVMVVS